MELFDKEVLKSISKKLIRKKQSLAVAESVTSGLVQFALSNAPDGASFFQGGVTTYNIAQKYKFLNVEPIHALAVNCVSQKVADEMALNASSGFLSDWGIGLTGYATKVPESGNKRFAFFSIAYRGKIVARRKMKGRPGEPMEQQVAYGRQVLAALNRLIK